MEFALKLQFGEEQTDVSLVDSKILENDPPTPQKRNVGKRKSASRCSRERSHHVSSKFANIRQKVSSEYTTQRRFAAMMGGGAMGGGANNPMGQMGQMMQSMQQVTFALVFRSTSLRFSSHFTRYHFPHSWL